MKVTFRKAEEKDCTLLFQWRDEATIANSAQPRTFTMEEHEAWFKNKLQSKTNLILIGEFGENKPFGVIRFDQMIDGAEVSINIDPNLRGKGLGRKLLQAAIKDEKCTLFATIRAKNVASLIIFLASGFQLSEYNSRTGLVYLRKEAT